MSEPTVLVVEPNAALSKRLRELLVGAGHTVIACGSFGEGRQYLAGNTPDAIVARIRLHAYNGLHLVLLARRHARRVPALVYSGSDDAGIQHELATWDVTYLDESALLTSLVPWLAEHLTVRSIAVGSPA